MLLSERVCSANLLDSGLRRNDRRLHPTVIPAKAGIHDCYPDLLRSYKKRAEIKILI